MKDVEVTALPLNRLGALIGPTRYEPLLAAAERFRARRRDAVVWNVNATATGGGVAEMLQTLLAYTRGLGVDTRWQVLDGEPDFFTLTKRIHNMIHGSPGDGKGLGEADHEVYERVLAANLEDLLRVVEPGHLVLLHDPQTAGLTAGLKEIGAHVVFRSHIGRDEPNDQTAQAWAFLEPYLREVDAIVVSRPSYAPPFEHSAPVHVIPPSIDPFATKNIAIAGDVVNAVLARAGVIDAPDLVGEIDFPRRAGGEGEVRTHDDVMVEGGPLPPEAPYILQVSRWDQLKDMPGVMRAFTDHVVGHDDTHLVLAGPATEGVSDDPEGDQVLQECRDLWRELPPEQQARVHLACVPMDDVDENAYIVNALQRRAAAVVQKSLFEGFGLTVTEAMWKGRPVLASAVGGINDQIDDGESGLLLTDPHDLEGMGALMQRVLDDPALAAALGSAAHERVLAEFLGDRHLMQYAELFDSLA